MMKRSSLLMGFTVLSLLAACSPGDLNPSSSGSSSLLNGSSGSSNNSSNAGSSSDTGSNSNSDTGSTSPGSIVSSESNFDANTTFSSVIIDARGLKISASMSPTIADDAEELFPGNMAVDPDFAVNEGIAAYIYGDLEAARKSSRAGSAPLIIRAAAADGRSGVKLSAQDGKNLKAANSKGSFLKNFKVIFLLDKT